MGYDNHPTKVADLKVVLLGESAVGKSSLVQRFATNSFDNNRESTIGAAFITKKIYLSDENLNNNSNELKLINFQIWDTAGQERYKSLTPMYYRNANVAIVVYDLTDYQSLKKAENWVNELKLYIRDNQFENSSVSAKNSLTIYLVGNKLDLLSIKENEGPEFPLSLNNIQTYKTSALTGEGIDTLFNSIINDVTDDQFVDVDDLDFDKNSKNHKNSRNGLLVDLTAGRGGTNSSDGFTEFGGCSC
ncbi:hypothetical protein PACTADRAFT_43121 [Pachysolen tannophilus NRRL Y-2460]|uniref:GTP-binding protein YPT52 n=1 Tax=Pachysolen tannophilus NRRL Y-2460 TaxID=669874 RepID=A0A1E4TUB6_PACTA|nr:hypothetical protein PACTADRAFT_43121 [Pachysolen tannophilus NRRL Y-2460]